MYSSVVVCLRGWSWTYRACVPNGWPDIGLDCASYINSRYTYLNMNQVSTVMLGIKQSPKKKQLWRFFRQIFWAYIMIYWTKNGVRTNSCLHFQLCSLISELALAAASEKGLTFEEGMEDRMCAYSRAVAHFPTAVKEVMTQLMEWIFNEEW